MDETNTFAFSIIELQALTPQIKTGAIILLFIANTASKAIRGSGII